MVLVLRLIIFHFTAVLTKIVPAKMLYSSKKNELHVIPSLWEANRDIAFVDLWTELDRQLEKSPAVATNLLFELLLTFQKIMFPQLLKWLLILSACLWAVLLWPKVLTLIRGRSQIELPIVLADIRIPIYGST